MSTVTQLRSPEQYMAALELANRIRSRRAVLKQKLGCGAVSPIAVLLDVPYEATTMKVTRFLLTTKGIGFVKARRLMNDCRISDSKTLGGLSDRQRDELVAAFQERGVQ